MRGNVGLPRARSRGDVLRWAQDMERYLRGNVTRGSIGGTGVAANPWFMVTKNATTASTADVGAGYGCYAGTWTEISDGTGTIITYTTNGTSYASVKLDLATGTWSIEKTDTSLPTNTDSVQFWVLAKVTVASAVISSIEQRWFGGWAIYETRA